MREIKFRGKVDHVPTVADCEVYRGVKVGDWVFGNYYKAQSEISICVDYGDYYDGNYCIDYSVDPRTIGQFTGLLDKNGKEIYEGDICICTRGKESKDASVIYAEGGFWLDFSSNQKAYLNEAIKRWNGKVIGNIHEGVKR